MMIRSAWARWGGVVLMCVCGLGIGGGGGGSGGCAAPATRVVLVRHAEKGEGADPSLTPAGHERALALVEVAGDAGVGAIYVTQFRRTQETAGPLAERLGLTPKVFAATGDVEAHAHSVAADILANHRGRCVLVVGHSNTVPRIIAALGATAPLSSPPPQIAEDEFDRVFVVVAARGGEGEGRGELVRARYGR